MSADDSGDGIMVSNPVSLIGSMTTDSVRDPASNAMSALRKTYAALGVHPTTAMWDSLYFTVEAIHKAAVGQKESKFYLCSLDPGVGKTQLVVHYLRALVASEREEDKHLAAVVFMFSKVEIAAMVSALGLPREQVAVITSDDEVNKLGAIDPSSARILITTQQRLQLLGRNTKFAHLWQFHYQDEPRQVRIWDESLLPADPISVGRQDFIDLAKPLRAKHPGLADDLEKLFAKLVDQKASGTVDIPDLAAQHGIRHQQAVAPSSSDDLKTTAAKVWEMFGKTASVCNDGPDGCRLVSLRQSVPDDFAPAVILDASGRVRTAYALWDKQGSLERLPLAPKNYTNLTVHLWNHGGGKSAFVDHRPLLLDGIVSTIKVKPDTERWLVVTHQAHEVALQADVRAMVGGAPERISFIHWGEHRATNAYRDLGNVILAGTWFLPPSAYEGVARAASNLWPADGTLSAQQLKDIRLGEHRHVILQAACRGAVRGMEEGKCGRCDLYIIGSKRQGITAALIEETFPGCSVVEWAPNPKLSDKGRQAIHFIVLWCHANPAELLTFKAVMEHVGEADRSNFQRLREAPAFASALKRARIFQPQEGRPGGFMFLMTDEDVARTRPYANLLDEKDGWSAAEGDAE